MASLSAGAPAAGQLMVFWPLCGVTNKLRLPEVWLRPLPEVVN
jgi:hypothetical protein